MTSTDWAWLLPAALAATVAGGAPGSVVPRPVCQPNTTAALNQCELDRINPRTTGTVPLFMGAPLMRQSVQAVRDGSGPTIR